MPTLHCDISESLWAALQRQAEESGENIAHIVSRALADSLQVEHGTLFQVSTSGALVEGLFEGVVSVGTLRTHGNFGLGTFVDFDGEMIVVDGVFYQMRSDGSIRVPGDAELVPYAIVTHFEPDGTAPLSSFASFEDLVADLDRRRTSDNLFYAVRITGHFAKVSTRIACKAEAGETLLEASRHQSQFHFADVMGTLLGFWTPAYVKGVGIPGWHLHFITDDRSRGGHVFDCAGEGLELAIEHLDDFRVSIPETAAFLAADLTRDITAELEKAERPQ